MNFAEAPPFRTLGNVVAVGVVAAFFYSVLLPALLAVLPLKQGRSMAKIRPAEAAVVEFALRHPRRLFWTTIAVICVLAAGVVRVQLDDDFMRYFDTRYPVRQANDFIEANLTGLDVIEYSLRDIVL